MNRRAYVASWHLATLCCDASIWSLLELERTYNAAQQTERIKRLGLVIGWTQGDRDAQARHGFASPGNSVKCGIETQSTV